jgi:putative heme-binding domain-containing protein
MAPPIRKEKMRGRASRCLILGLLLGLGLATGLDADLRALQLRPGEYSPADIQYGSRLFAAQCATCHGPAGDAVAGVDLRNGPLRRAASDADLSRLIASGIPGTAMPPQKFSAPELVALVAYIRNMRDFDSRAVSLGDANRGKALFAGKAGCLTCHRVAGNGRRTGPDLTAIGNLRSAGVLERSLLEPTETMLPFNRSVRAVTRDGRIINGRRLNEDTYTVQLIDDQERLLSLDKGDLREYTVLKTSAMSSYRDKLSRQELADLLAYLVTLKGI